MDKAKDLHKKYVNMEKFMFIKEDKEIELTAFFKKMNLQSGVLIVSSINLILGVGQLVDAIEKGRFMMFLCYTPPALVLILGSILLLLATTNFNSKSAYWGYIATAAFFYLELVFLVFFSIWAFLFDRTLFSKSIIGNAVFFIITIVFQIYFAWIDYCFAKHINQGNSFIVHRNVDNLVAISSVAAQKHVDEGAFELPIYNKNNQSTNNPAAA